MDEMSQIRALAVDDDSGDLKSFERLSKYGVACTAVPPPPPEAFAEKIFKPIEGGDVDVVLLDFRLDADSEVERSPATYRGGMLAAAIKERFPEMPVVLVTTESKHKEYVKDNPRIRDLFDYRLLKSIVFGRPARRESAALKIIDLAKGMKRVVSVLERNAKDAWNPYLQLLSITRAELEALKDSVGGPGNRKPADLANWILRDLLPFPGLLLDRNEAQARLGLIASSFNRETVQQWAEPARYRGVFGELQARWWEGRLLDLLRETAGGAAANSAKKRAVAIASACGESSLRSARCPWCKGSLVQRACHVCKKAVDATHHLVARVDTRPAWALPAAVCFRCIESGRDEADSSVQYGPGAHEIVEILRTASE